MNTKTVMASTMNLLEKIKFWRTERCFIVIIIIIFLILLC